MTTVYFIRHAQAEGNKLGVAQGHLNGKVTTLGRAQIKTLAHRFASVPIDAVYASDLLRTQETAEAICGPKGLPLHTEPAFREIFMGTWEGRLWSELEIEEPEQIDAFANHIHLWHPHGGETPQQVAERFLPALHRIVKENEGRSIAVVSHGCALRIVLSILQGITIDRIGNIMHGDNTSVSCAEFDGDTVRVLFRDDNSHLMAEGLSSYAVKKQREDTQ